MKYLYIFILVFYYGLIFPAISFSQGEGNNWYFGRYAGITFNTSPPTVLNNGQLITSEGCASVSDKDGNLVFYTDGSTVFSSNHTVMQNGTGLRGNNSSTQSSVVCPKPGTYNYNLKRFDRYYIVTIDVANGSNGVRYSEVDMTANGGLGSIVNAFKNIHLFGTTTIEGANVVKHANGCDYWIVGKEVGNNRFNVYHVTSSGVSNSPVVSNVGAISTATWGSIKVAPNNKLIAYNSNSVGTQIFDFDNSTGVLTLKFSDPQRSYSSEFSSNSNVLYVTHLPYPEIYQYDLTANNNTAFLSSKLVVGTTANTALVYDMCGVQLAPDGKIYCALMNQTRLGAIENPNILGLGCTYNDNALNIAGTNLNGNPMSVVLGLPAFPAFFIFPNDIQFESANYNVNQYFCNTDSITFNISDTNSVQSVDWYVSPINSAYNTNPDATSYVYTIPPPVSGDYKIMAIVNYSCFIDSIIDTITVNSTPNISLGPDIDSCTNNPIVLDATRPGISSYSWSNSVATAVNSISSSNQYILEVTDAIGCVNSDTINITINEVPNASFIASPVCLNESSLFTNQSSISIGSITNHSWSFNDGNNSNSPNPIHTYQNDGTYSVELIVTSNNGCKDTVNQNHIVHPIPTTNAGIDTTLNCLIDTLILDGSLSSSGVNYSYSWSTNNGNIISNTTNDSIEVDLNGMYYLNVTDNSNSCVTIDSVLVNIDTILPSFNIGTDTLLTCSNPSILFGALNNQTGNFNYVWTTNNGNILNGANTLTPEINQIGEYYLTVNNTLNYCSKIDSISVSIDTIHPLTIVNLDTLINCLNPQITLSGTGSSVGNYNYLWNTNDGNILSGITTLSPEINASGVYTLTVTNNYNGCSTSNQVVVSQNDSAFVNILFNESSAENHSIFSFVSNSLSYQGNPGPVNWSVNNTSFTSDSTFEYNFENSGSHEIVIELTNQVNGCIVYDTVFLTVTHQLEIPNLISPNADGFNDDFIIRALENYDDNSLSIFNRWGEPVFNSTPYLNDWNGQTNVNGLTLGDNVVDGTYFYILSLTKNNEETILRGYIELKRK